MKMILQCWRSKGKCLTSNVQYVFMTAGNIHRTLPSLVTMLYVFMKSWKLSSALNKRFKESKKPMLKTTRIGTTRFAHKPECVKYLVPGGVVNGLVLGGIVVQIQLVPIESPWYKDNFALLRIKGEMFHIKWAICLHYGWEHPENAAVGSNYNIGVQEILKAIIRTKIKRQNARINERNQLYFNAMQRKKSQITTNRVLLYKYIRQCQFRLWFLAGTWFVSSTERNSPDWKISPIFFFFLKQDDLCWWEYYSRL